MKEADEGGSITIINNIYYTTDCTLLPNDTNTYQTTSSDIIDKHVAEAKNLVKNLTDSNRQIIYDLLPDQPASIFYGLSKLHKLIQLILSRHNENSLYTSVNLSSTSNIVTEATKLNISHQYRPIVSCIGTITEHTFGFVDYILQPLLQNIPSYLNDTTHFHRSLSSHIDTLDPGSMLISMDANSLYTNIPHANVVAACRILLSKNNIQSDIATDIPILIYFILTHNTLAFNDKYYLQNNFIAMPFKMTTAYANIFMEYVKN